jgi:hypothetical protein
MRALAELREFDRVVQAQDGSYSWRQDLQGMQRKLHARLRDEASQLLLRDMLPTVSEEGSTAEPSRTS